MFITAWDIVRMSIETVSDAHPELIRDGALFRQIWEDCEKLAPLVEEGRVFGVSASPIGEGRNFEVELFFAKGTEYSEENRILAEILPHAVRIGVCTDEDKEWGDEDGEGICLGIRWDYPPLFRSPEE